MGEHESGDDDILADIGERLAETRSGSLSIRHATGVVNVTADAMRWWSEISDDEARDFAERLAAIAEDPRLILAATDVGEVVPGARMGRRTVDISRGGGSQ